MYLKRMEIIGFKSFADKTTLILQPGVTGVVGPNGSGKSNITEAVRWVLGETSAKSLRGGKMPDIIFAGSQTRKPLNIAEVTVILDNEDHYLPLDYTEIAVTRRLNRNGDSDYYINKKRARLKDIQELFMDSGLGKESFSIISQGKVEAIFNSKPEDRRGIFEEAAGVFKYKQRKKEAEHKLFETEDNLSRVKDIIYELKEQLVPLKEESEKAKRYLQLKDQLKKVEVAYTAEKIHLWQDEWQQVKVQLQEMTARLAEIEEKETSLEKQIQTEKTAQRNHDLTLTKQQEELVTLTRTFEQTQSKRDLLAQASQSNEEKRVKLEAEKAQLELTCKRLLEKIKEDETSLFKNQEKLDNLTEVVSQEMEHVKQYSRSIKEQLEDLRADFIEWMQQETNVSNDKKHLARQLEQGQQQKKLLAEKIQFAKNELEQLEEELASFVTRKTAASEKLTKLIALTENKQNQLNSLQENYDSLQQSYYQALGSLQQKEGRLKSLKEIALSHAGYYQGVRGILRNQQLIGIKGAVAELMTVASDYTVALETALGASAQHVIVENEEAARLAIDYLKQNRLGRATFLPLTSVKPRSIPSYLQEELKEMPGFLGVAVDLVDFDANLSVAYHFLLGSTLIAKDLPTAIKIAQKVRHQYKVVSLAGEVMNAGGSMSGGASKNTQSGLLTQKNEEKALNDEVKKLQETVSALELKVKESQQTQEKLKKELLILRQNEEAGRLFLQKMTTTIAEKNKDTEQMKKEVRIFGNEEQQLRIELSENLKEQENLEEQQLQIEKEKAKLQEEIKLLETTGNTNESLKLQAQEKLQSAQKDQAVLEGNQAFLRDRLQTNQRENEEKNQKLQEVTMELTAISKTEAWSKEDLESLLEELSHKKEALQENIKHNQAQKETLLQQLETLDETQQILQKEKQKMLLEQGKLEGRYSKLETQLDNSLVFLQEEYQLTFEKAQKEYRLEMPLEKAQEEVKTYKETIQKLGSVHLGAIEQYQEVNERYEFLESQKEDLLMAKEHLFTTMDEMDEEVKQRFFSTFTEIKDQFEMIFPKMFGGGKASLLLTDPEDLLNTGVEIEAQPPGKKLQSLNLLSGGERALTAITLLFAILQVRPVPFTILDEVEAALDEANVTRFGEYLQSFEEARQFIVVTHRKGTMASCDTLYGVTMEESGVSKVLSVELAAVKDNGEIVK